MLTATRLPGYVVTASFPHAPVPVLKNVDLNIQRASMFPALAVDSLLTDSSNQQSTLIVMF